MINYELMDLSTFDVLIASRSSYWQLGACLNRLLSPFHINLVLFENFLARHKIFQDHHVNFLLQI